MTILAIDTCLDACSVAVASDGRTLARASETMAPAATLQVIARKGPVAIAKVMGSEKTPAPITEPMTSADNENRDNLLCDNAAMMDAIPKNFFSRGLAPLCDIMVT